VDIHFNWKEKVKRKAEEILSNGEMSIFIHYNTITTATRENTLH